MTEFLSEEWIESLDARLRADPSGASPKSLTIQYEISDGADKVCYYLVLGPAGDRAASGSAEEAHVTFRMDRESAREISDGNMSTEDAFIAGRLDLDGDPGPLIEAYRAADDA